MTKLQECRDRDIVVHGWASHITVTFNRIVAPRSKATICGRWPTFLDYDSLAPHMFVVSPATRAADAFEIFGLYFDGCMELCHVRASDFTGDDRLHFNRCAFGTRMELVVQNESDMPQRMIAFLAGYARRTEVNWKLREASWKDLAARGAPPKKHDGRLAWTERKHTDGISN
jgi:hypothetical protein